jgi:GTP-binding protein HflX
LSADKLFATLDPTSRRLKLPNGRMVVLTDTVGFIRKLPHRLVDSFKATLEEALVADLVLHLVDFSNPQYEAQMSTTDDVLRELGAAEKELITVFNKMDLVENDLEKFKAKKLTGRSVFISANTGEGIDLLLVELEHFFASSAKPENFTLPYNRYDLVARLKSQGELIYEETTEEGYFVKGNPRGDLSSAFEKYRQKEG